MSKLTTRIIIAATAALSYFAFVQANDEVCGPETETVIIQPETTSYRIIPGEYQWVDGELNGYSLEYRVVPAEFENREVTQEAYPVAKFMANLVKDGRTRIQTKRPKYEAIKLSAQTRTFSRAKACEVVSSANAGI